MRNPSEEVCLLKISTAKKTRCTVWTTCIVIGILLCVWEIAARIVGQEIYLPSFLQTISTLFSLASEPSFYVNIVSSVARVVLGFILALFLGTALGICSAFCAILKKILNPLMAIMKSTPVASFILLFLIWMKASVATVLIALMMLVPIFYANALLGVEEIDEKLTKLCIVYKMPMGTYIKTIVFPLVTPYIKSAMLTALGFAYKTIISAEVIAQPKYGIGSMLYESKLYLETAQLFSYTICIIALSMAFEALIRTWVKRTGAEEQS